MTRRASALAVVPDRTDITSWADEFDHELEAAGKASKTRLTYRQSIDGLEAFLATGRYPLRVAAITKREIESYLIHERDRGMSDNTILIRFRSLRPFFNFLAREGVVAPSPMAGMPQPTVRDAPPPTISDDDLVRLFRACAGTDFEDRRDLAIVTLFTDTGIRLGEMNSLRVVDIDLAAKEMLVNGKTGRRIVPYSAATRRHLERYLRMRGDHRDADLTAMWLGKKGRLGYYGIGEMLARRARKAGLIGEAGKAAIHPHLFRHTFAHNYLSEGEDGEPAGFETDLKQLGGWRDLATVERYGRSAAGARARRNFQRHSLVDRLTRGDDRKR